MDFVCPHNHPVPDSIQTLCAVDLCGSFVTYVPFAAVIALAEEIVECEQELARLRKILSDNDLDAD